MLIDVGMMKSRGEGSPYEDLVCEECVVCSARRSELAARGLRSVKFPEVT